MVNRWYKVEFIFNFVDENWNIMKEVKIMILNEY